MLRRGDDRLRFLRKRMETRYNPNLHPVKHPSKRRENGCEFLSHPLLLLLRPLLPSEL
jgi:hypothetical protein